MSADKRDRIGPDAEDHYKTYGVELLLAIVLVGVVLFLIVGFFG